MALSGTRLAVTNRTAESWWLFSGQLLAVTNRTAESWWLFLGQLLAVTNRTAESWWLFLANSWPYKSYCRVSVALSGNSWP